MCPRKYQYKYVDALPYTPIYNLESGKALHAGLEENNNTIKAGDAPLTDSQIVEKAVDVFKGSNEDKIEEADFDLGEGTDRLVGDITAPVGVYKKSHEDELREQGIVEAEKPFTFELAGEKVIGYIDLVTNDIIIDYKLLGRKKNQQAINMDPQLVLYEHIEGKPGFFMEFIRKRKRAEISQPRRTPGTARAILKWIEEQISGIEKAKKSGDFPRAQPTNWMCKGCEFRYKCWEGGV
jgi:CRISPR/Cas system-associated exonuclease Cas4 (RecB family)